MDKKTFNSLFTSRSDAVIAIKDGVIVYFNGAAEKAFGKIEEGQKANELFSHLLLGDGEENVTGTAVCKNGNAPATSTHLGDMRIITVMPEMTTDDLFMDTLGSVNSVIRDSLSVMHMSNTILGQRIEIPQDEKVQRYSAILNHAYYKLARVTDHLAELCVQGEEKLNISCFDIVELCRNTIESTAYLASINGPKIVLESKESSILFNGDEGRIEQMLLNLLSNSLKYTKADGTIRVIVKKQTDGVIITVADNGCGVDEKVMPELFSVYHGVRDLKDVKAGVGMGLPLVQHIAHLHSGSAVLESTRGKGTIVTVLLKSKDDDMKVRVPAEEYKVRGLSRTMMELADNISYDKFVDTNLD